MKIIKRFLFGNFQVLEVKFSLYLNRHDFVMTSDPTAWMHSLILVFTGRM